MPVENPIPILFPQTLQDACIAHVLRRLIRIGQTVEAKAKRFMAEEARDTFESSSLGPMGRSLERGRRRSSLMFDLSDYIEASFLSRLGMKDRHEVFFTRTDCFTHSVITVRNHLVNFMAAHLVDIIADSARKEGNIAQPGHVFLFSVLYNERLQKLVACHHDEQVCEPEPVDEDGQSSGSDPWEALPRDWTHFLESAIGSDLFLAGLGQMSGLYSLTIHHVCNNDMLFIIADTCSRLQILDISYSSQVSDLGLIYLGGITNSTLTHDRFLPKPPVGCKSLKELVLNPHSRDPLHDPATPIMPKVVAYLLKHLSIIEVLDLEQLHEGIEYYYFGPVNGTYHRKPERIAPLKLIHYTGSDRLGEVMDICPRLRIFKLFVTSALASLGQVLQEGKNHLDHVSLIYKSPSQVSLMGLKEFLVACGKRISSLSIECSPHTVITLEDLQAIARQCKFLDTLTFNQLRVEARFEAFDELEPLKMPFLTTLRLSQVSIDRRGKDFFRFLLGGSPDLERLYLSFTETAYFFNDFVVEDILHHNPLNRLEHLIIKDVSLTLISALRLISTRGKLRSIGSVLTWDVEPSELLTFAQILRRANSLKLLQKIAIV